MKVLVDETGELEAFQPNHLAIVTLVTITEAEEPKTAKFLSQLFPDGLSGVKGKTIPFDKRERLLRYIGKKQEIKYAALALDITQSEIEAIKVHQREQATNIQKSLDDQRSNLSISYQRDVELLIRQIKGLSTADYLKFQLVSESLLQWQKYVQFDYMHTRLENDTWCVHHRIDMQAKKDRFARLVHAYMKLTHGHLSGIEAILTPQEWGGTHPFEVYHRTEVNGRPAFDGGRLYEDFKVTTEEEEPLLLLPDLIGNTIYRSIKNWQEGQWLRALRRIKTSRSFSLKRGQSDDYYQLRTFNQNRSRDDVSGHVRGHFNAMKWK